MEKKEQKYITLKEASKISGYAPDYIGQLIRKGKITGKQVYLNVAWMTTEEAVKEYVEKSQSKLEPSLKELAAEKLFLIKNSVRSDIKITKVFTVALWMLSILILLFALLLFYIFSVNLEKKFDRHAIDTLQKKSAYGVQR